MLKGEKSVDIEFEIDQTGLKEETTEETVLNMVKETSGLHDLKKLEEEAKRSTEHYFIEMEAMEGILSIFDVEWNKDTAKLEDYRFVSAFDVSTGDPVELVSENDKALYIPDVIQCILLYNNIVSVEMSRVKRFKTRILGVSDTPMK